MGPVVFAATLTTALAVGLAQAQVPAVPADAGEIHGLKLGLKADAMRLEGCGELACGSNGGPPRQKLTAWSQFRKCRAEDSGLHEVTARFDDEDEYIAKAIDEPLYQSQHRGTRVAGHPVILSALFDDSGMLRGIRFVSDPAATPLERRMAHLLQQAVINRYGAADWTCTDLPRVEGETPVGGVYIKQRCTKDTAARQLALETHFLRKPGQQAVNPATREYTQGEFESWTRFELLDPTYAKP